MITLFKEIWFTLSVFAISRLKYILIDLSDVEFDLISQHIKYWTLAGVSTVSNKLYEISKQDNLATTNYTHRAVNTLYKEICEIKWEVIKAENKNRIKTK